MATGNLNIIISGDTNDGSGSSPPVSFNKEDFDEKETEVILKLFKKEMEDIAYFATINRIDAEGGPTLSICYEEKKAEKARPALADLRKKVLSIEQKSVQIPTDKKKEFYDFVRKFESNPDVLLLPDDVYNLVQIKGKSSKSVDETAHELKVALGKLHNSTSRVNRQSSDTGDSKPSYASIVSKGGFEEKGSKISNIDKYKKPHGPFQDNPAQSADKPRNRSNKTFSSSTRAGSYGASADEDLDFMTELKNGFILKVYKASITSLDVDVIVNAANETMMHGGGVARVISDAAGYKLDKESRDHVERYGSVNVCKNIVTTAGRLHYQAVIHAVGPVWHDYKDKVRCLDDLYDCVYNLLETCKKNSFRTVAMSAISAGIFAVPKELCADMYVYAAASFSKTRLPSECPKELHIIDVDTKILQLVVESVKRWQQDHESLNQRKTVPEYLKKNPPAYFSSHNTEGHRPSSRHRGHRHGSRGQNSGTYNGDGVHGNVPRPIVPVQSDESPLELTCGIKRLTDEKFKWGGKARIFVLETQLTVKIFKGEISKVREMDAVVCGTDKNLSARGFIADALKKAGGQWYTSSYDKMVQKHKYDHLKSSDVFKCEGGALGSRYVLHAVVNRLVDANSKEIQEYQNCFDSILKKVKRNGFRKLAIPLLGTGTLQTNKRKLKLCGKALLKALDDYMMKFADKNELEEIHLINNNDIVTDALEEVFSEAANLKNSSNTKSKESFDGNRRQSSMGERNYAAGGQDDRRGPSSHDLHRGRDGRNGKKEGNARAEIIDKDSDNDHYDTVDNAESKQARQQGSLNPGKEKRNKKNVNSAGAKGKETDSDSDHYDSIDPEKSKQDKQQTTPKPADSSSEGNLMIIES